MPAGRKWDIDVAEAINLQRRLAGQVRQTPLGRPIRHIAGADVSFSQDGQYCIAAVVVMSWPKMQMLTVGSAIQEVEFPYIPGLLSFREAPAVLAAARKLSLLPDVLLVDGQGLAHPRRFGLACHVGVELGWPTIGCAKSRLIGTHRMPGLRRGCRCRLKDNGEVIGTVLRSRDQVKCLYVSVGHLMELAEAVKVVLRCCRQYRVPEPIRLSHQWVGKLRCQSGMDKTNQSG